MFKKDKTNEIIDSAKTENKNIAVKLTTKVHSSFLGQYFYQSKAIQNAALYVFPIFIIYQFGVLFTGGVQNGVDFITPKIFQVLGWLIQSLDFQATKTSLQTAYGMFLMIAIFIYLLIIYLGQKKESLNVKIWPIILLESFVYALFFGQIVHLLMSFFHINMTLMSFAPSIDTSGGYMPSGFSAFILSFGAGFYEELVFRVIILSGSVWFLSRKIAMSRFVSVLISVFVSSLVFSAIHHLGSLGDPFTIDVFLFRFFAGIVLSTIYAVRGFSVAVYTHAFYDVLVMVL